MTDRLAQTQDLMHIPPDPGACRVPSTAGMKGPFMTLNKEAITRSVFDRLDLSKAASAMAVEATFNHSMFNMANPFFITESFP
jgi:hypothetical protein